MRTIDIRPGITHGEIEEAMKFFFEQGGKIKTLPAQKSTSVTMIGQDKWNAFESIGELRF